MFADMQHKIRDCKICVMLNAQKKKKCALGKRSFPKTTGFNIYQFDSSVTNIEWQQQTHFNDSRYF